jgi:subfamily B ATP-binding cassette protein MsbA
MLKNIIKKHFQSLVYFYAHLKHRIFVVLILSILIGILDGLGLTMFLPLLQIANDSSSIDPDSLGKLSFIIDFIEYTGIGLNLIAILIFMLFFFYSKGVVQYIFGVYKVNVLQGFITRLRLKMLSGLQGLSYKYFVMADAGRIQNTLTGEVARVAKAFTSYFKAFQYGIMVTVYMLFAFSIDAQFALLVSVGGLLTNFLYKSLYKNTKVTSRKLTGDSNDFQSLIIQKVSNFKYLKATGSLGKYGDKLSSSILDIENSNKKIGKLGALLVAGKEPILVTVVVIIIYIQTSILGSPLEPILISLVFFYRALIYLMQMQVEYNAFLAVSGSLENMSRFEKELLENKETPGKNVINEPVKEMKLSSVSFYYNNTCVLQNIDLTVNKHETLAFVGESGSGKTTLVNILSGLFPVETGEYRINGSNANGLNMDAFQGKIGYITQDSVIFNDTLFNNVSFWAPPTEENIQKFWIAIKKAALLDFAESLPLKENEILGNNGINLSGGQKQRISIARELYKDVEILILDEATSALDSETEKAIQQNIDELKGQYTILIVAHRISTIKNADRIVVVKNGKISNINSFDNLIGESPYFKKLVELQEI